MGEVKIRGIKTILTAPNGVDLAVVKVETTEPGLYGIGCATFTQRYGAVKTAVDEYLAPLLTGKEVNNIEDIWQLSAGNSYWRNGPVLNNAISGVDEALWDIKGKMAGMPVYELLGGRCRPAAAVYRHADGRDEKEVLENVQKYMDEGYHYVRIQMGTYGGRDPDHAYEVYGTGRYDLKPIRREPAEGYLRKMAGEGAADIYDGRAYKRNRRRGKIRDI